LSERYFGGFGKNPRNLQKLISAKISANINLVKVFDYKIHSIELQAEKRFEIDHDGTDSLNNI